MKIDPKQRGHLPGVDEPSPFVSPDGRFRGWRVTIPGRRGGTVVGGLVLPGEAAVAGVEGAEIVTAEASADEDAAVDDRWRR